jgi:hypothetical protein
MLKVAPRGKHVLRVSPHETKIKGRIPESTYNVPMTLDIERMQDFIRSTLGCGCPDEVLQWIECSRSIPVPEHSLMLTRIDVGGRLLVYVVEADETPETAVYAIPALMAAGLAERDRAGFNRLRLVLASDEPEVVRSVAEKVYSESAPRDDRVHLHVVAATDLPFD